MICYDCLLSGKPENAIGVCVACGAAICANHASIARQTIHHQEGLVGAGPTTTDTRALNCHQCAKAVSHHHSTDFALIRQ